VITILREAHQAVEAARARGQPALDAGLLAGLRQRYDDAVAFGITRNRLRDWDGDGNHPGYTLGCWLREHAGQVWLFTTEFDVEWTSDLASHCTSWGCCAVSGLAWWSGCLGARIVACASDISGAARGPVGVAAA
jgi:hypothetical protein